MKATFKEIEKNLTDHANHIIQEEKASYEIYKMKIGHLIDNARYAEKEFSEHALLVLKSLETKAYYDMFNTDK